MEEKPSSRDEGQERDAGPPKDEYGLVYGVLMLMGAGLLFPYNTLVNAVDFFHFTFPKTELQFYVPIVMNVSSPLIQVAMIKFGKHFSFTRRIILWFSVEGVILGCIPFIVTRDAVNDVASLRFCLMSIFTCGFATAVLQSSLFGFSAMLPTMYTQAVMTGNGIAGVTVSACRVFTKYYFPMGVDGLFEGSRVYFLLAAFTTLMCAVGYVVILRLPFTRYHMRQHDKNRQSVARPVEITSRPRKHIRPGKRIAVSDMPFLSGFAQGGVYVNSLRRGSNVRPRDDIDLSRSTRMRRYERIQRNVIAASGVKCPSPRGLSFRRFLRHALPARIDPRVLPPTSPWVPSGGSRRHNERTPLLSGGAYEADSPRTPGGVDVAGGSVSVSVDASDSRSYADVVANATALNNSTTPYGTDININTPSDRPTGLSGSSRDVSVDIDHESTASDSEVNAGPETARSTGGGVGVLARIPARLDVTHEHYFKIPRHGSTPNLLAAQKDSAQTPGPGVSMGDGYAGPNPHFEYLGVQAPESPEKKAAPHPDTGALEAIPGPTGSAETEGMVAVGARKRTELSYWTVFCKIYGKAFSVCFVFAVTFLVFPGLTSLIPSYTFGLQHGWFPLLLITEFNCFDLLGRYMPKWFHVSENDPSLKTASRCARIMYHKHTIYIITALRFVFLPLFLMFAASSVQFWGGYTPGGGVRDVYHNHNHQLPQATFVHGYHGASGTFLTGMDSQSWSVQKDHTANTFFSSTSSQQPTLPLPLSKPEPEPRPTQLLVNGTDVSNQAPISSGSAWVGWRWLFPGTRPLSLMSDFWPLLCLMLFAVSNGYFASVLMMEAPKQVEPHEREATGSLMSIFLNLGILIGSSLAVIVRANVVFTYTPE